MGRCHHEALPCPPSQERAWRGLHGLGWGAQPLGVKTAVPMWRAVSSGLTLGVTSHAAIFPAITTLVWAGGAVTGGCTTAPRKHIPDEVMVCVCHREQHRARRGRCQGQAASSRGRGFTWRGDCHLEAVCGVCEASAALHGPGMAAGAQHERGAASPQEPPSPQPLQQLSKPKSLQNISGLAWKPGVWQRGTYPEQLAGGGPSPDGFCSGSRDPLEPLALLGREGLGQRQLPSHIPTASARRAPGLPGLGGVSQATRRQTGAWSAVSGHWGQMAPR